MHINDPECGYFKVRDRRGVNMQKAPIKRPWVAAAIWHDGENFRAEIAGKEIEIDHAWPWIAKYTIPHETYVYWHKHERWPEGVENV